MENREYLGTFNKAVEADDLSLPIHVLRNNAFVIETGAFWLLQSYETIIAVMDKETRTCIDALRYVYHFTRTSAKHVALFRETYGAKEYVKIS